MTQSTTNCNTLPLIAKEGATREHAEVWGAQAAFTAPRVEEVLAAMAVELSNRRGEMLAFAHMLTGVSIAKDLEFEDVKIVLSLASTPTTSIGPVP